MITDKAMKVARVTPHSFDLVELSAVHIVRQRRRQARDGSRFMGVSALVSGVITIPIIGRLSAVTAALAVVVVVVYAIVRLGFGDHAHHELVATYRGHCVVLFESENQREFDQVCRGLQRALERLP